MRQLTTVSDIKQLGTILGVWAHPDDEAMSSGGIMAAAVVNGQKVVCLTATRGEQGVQDETRWPANKLGSIREEEFDAAMEIMGVEEHFWLDRRDGYCKPDDEAAILSVCEYIEKYHPNTILTFGPDGMTGHSDHKAVSEWVHKARQASQFSPSIYHAVQTKRQYTDFLKVMDKKLNIFFNIDEPPLKDDADCDIHFVLNDDQKNLKLDALKAMPSQTEGMMKLFDKDFICKALELEAFIKAE